MYCSVNDVYLTFVCPDCGYKETTNPWSLYYSGIPQCPDCDIDMEMEPEAVINEEPNV